MALSDIEIANQVKMEPIEDVAKKIGIERKNLSLYGDYKAKITIDDEELEKAPKGKLILVTAITPTPAGEGKTTVSVGLVDALAKQGKKLQLLFVNHR
jgi:Formyltetrahydrofolate synthetase